MRKTGSRREKLRGLLSGVEGSRRQDLEDDTAWKRDIVDVIYEL